MGGVSVEWQWYRFVVEVMDAGSVEIGREWSGISDGNDCA